MHPGIYCKGGKMAGNESELEVQEQAHTGSFYYRVKEAGNLRLDGPDRVDFLQRQSTNDIRKVVEGHAITTVLTSPTARILDVLLLFPEQDAIDIVTVPGRSASTARFLQSRIFFMDKVTVVDASAEFACFELHGPDLQTLLNSGRLLMPGQNEARVADLAGTPVTLIGRDGQWVSLLAPSLSAAEVETALSELGLSPVSTESYEEFRIEAGLPGHHELSEEFNPLEVNLRDAISDSKGCYTGQEIIARQITYDKVTRNLVGLRLTGSAERGSRILHEGRTVGEVTSSVNSPRFGWIGLAVIKRPASEPGTTLTIAANNRDVTATVVMLPFA
jgi:tRNA-modifying protein YgfZ